jgi:hypothetical protein
MIHPGRIASRAAPGRAQSTPMAHSSEAGYWTRARFGADAAVDEADEIASIQARHVSLHGSARRESAHLPRDDGARA